MLEPPPLGRAASVDPPMLPAPVNPEYAPQAELQTTSAPATAAMRGCSFSSCAKPMRRPLVPDSACDTGWARRATAATRLTASTTSQRGTPPPPDGGTIPVAATAGGVDGEGVA